MRLFLSFLSSFFSFFLFRSTLFTDTENGLHVRSIFEKLVKLNKGYKVKESIYTRIIKLNLSKIVKLIRKEALEIKNISKLRVAVVLKI